MTEFRLPPLVVDYDTELWFPAQLRGGAAAARGWALAQAPLLLARSSFGGLRTRKGERKLIAYLEQAAAIARKRQDASMALILFPTPAERVQGMAAFCPVDLAGHGGDEGRDLVLDQIAPKIPGDFPPEVTRLDTKAGTCWRVRQRYAHGEGADRPVGEHFSYLWVCDEYGAAIVMDIGFEDILQAARWLPALDELAAGVWLQT